MAAPIPPNEEARLQALHDYDILDTAAEKAFDDITALAANLCQTPISLLTFIDRDRQWFKSNVGMEARESSRDLAFCAHAILGDDLMIVPDALLDDRFAKNPMVNGDPHIRFYAGMPLVTPDGQAVGALCVIDRVPRELSQGQMSKMRALARSALMLLELRRGDRPSRP